MFLKLGQAAPHLNRMNQGILVFWLAMAPLLAVSTATPLLQTSIAAGILVSFLAIYTAAYLAWRGNVPARYLLIAWLTIIGATFLTLLSLIGAIDGGPWIDQSQHVGFVIETILLSMALAERIRRDRLSREAAQQEALALARRLDQEREAKIKAQELALDVHHKANEELELRVRDRTADLKRAMTELQLANGELATLSLTDSLTGVHNRRYFDDALRSEFDRSARTQCPVALLLADIDHFKRINDSVGHVAGDECLRLVANAMRACAGRSSDLVARYGGEEFAIVLPATDAAQAFQMAERIRRAVQDIQFISAGRRVPLSISLGVVARVTSADQTLAQFIREADEALYAAKAAGRNQVMLAAA